MQSVCSNLSSNALVRPLYMQQGNLFKHTALITKIGVGELKKKPAYWVQLNETIFHPQGGGQPSDQGTIFGIKVLHVNKERTDRIEQFEISHYLDWEVGKELPFKEGHAVELLVDEKVRKLHSRLHTGGHLLSDAVGALIPNLVGFQGNHSPTDSYVKFKMKNAEEYDKQALAEVQAKAQNECSKWIQSKLLVAVTTKDDMRAIQIGDCTPVPCGGTHIDNLAELGSLEVTGASYNKKESMVTIKYKIPM